VLANGNGQRKRLISERSEKESQYPRINRAVLFDTWDGCPYIPVVAQQARRCGIGLHNPMNNCFLNSVLQSIVHIPHLARMLVESTDWQICTRNPQCLHCGLKDHILKAIRANYAFQPNWINNHLRSKFKKSKNVMKGFQKYFLNIEVEFKKTRMRC
jgi:ubiquitin C-terminal hydrolase